MKFFALAIVLAGFTAAAPAFAQLSASSGSDNPAAGGAAGGPAAPSLQPRPATPDFAPPALPGASVAPVATGPVVQKPGTGDPTTALFAAVNNDDYNAAQDAVSRGADSDATNSLGETPLDLSVALNHNDITFMLLSARNEANEGGGPQQPISQAAARPSGPAARPATTSKHRLYTAPSFMATPVVARPALPGNDPGRPDPNAGFLGFGSPN